MFRDKFWLSLALTIPVVILSPDIQEWFGYALPSFPGEQYVAAALGTIIFLYGGLVFIRGARGELADRKPGMMTLISLAIIVAFVTSWAGTLGLFEVEIWWELATLITIMLLGHWLEMRSIAQARGALTALAELLPDTAERVTEAGPRRCRVGACRSATSCSSGPVPASPPTATVVDGQRRRGRVDDHRRVPSGRQGARRPVVAGTVAAGGVAARPGHRDRRCDGAVGDHAAGRGGAGVASRGPGARRPSGRAPVLRGPRRRAGHPRRSGGSWATPRARWSARPPCWSSPARMPSAWPSRSSSRSPRRSAPATGCS